MAFFFGDGFDLYALPADAYNGYWDSGLASFALTTGRFSGSRAINNDSTSNSWLVKSSGQNDAVHHIVCAFQQTTAIGGTSPIMYFQLSDGATNQCCIVFRNDGAILLTSATALGATLATYTGAVTAINTWFAFEFEVVIHPTTGSFTVRKNGNPVNDFTAASLNTRPGTNNYANKLTVAGSNPGTSQSIDDLLWRSDAASVPWVGDIRCFTRMPNADVAAAWTRPATFQMQPYFGATTPGTVAANGARYTLFTSQGGSIGSVIVNLLVGYTGNMKCAIYASVGGQPGAVLQSATAAISNPVLGANTFTFSPAVSIAKGTQFFVATCVDILVSSVYSLGNTAPYSTAAFNATATTYANFPVANPPGLFSNVAAHPFFPVVTPAANADVVSEPWEDSAASYVYSSNVSDSDLYTLQSIGSTPATIVGVTTRGYVQKSDAGTRNVAVQLKSGATTVESASTALNTTWGWVSRNDLVDPATGAAWTAAGVNNANIGAVVKA